MADEKFPNSGMVFQRPQEEGKRRPIMSGPVEISRDLLKELLDVLKAGGTPTLDVTVWPCLKDKDKGYEPKLDRNGHRMYPTSVGLPYKGGSGSKQDEFEGLEMDEAPPKSLADELDDEIPF